jgi:glycosyltransferase involved in cell wall biosynthesis
VPQQDVVIGFDFLFADPRRVFGMWVYSKELLRELISLRTDWRFIAFAPADAATDLGLVAPNLSIVLLASSPVSAEKRILLQNTWLPLQCRKHGVALLHSTGNYGPIFAGVPHVVTVHDLLVRYDRLHFPDHCSARRARGVEFLIGMNMRTARAILTDSKFTLHELERTFGKRNGRMEVVYPGFSQSSKLDAREAALREEQNGRYIFALGVFPPHKNIERLIEAYSLLRQRSPIKHKLVIGGSPGPLRDQVERARERSGFPDDIVLLGYVPDDRLQELYQGADLFVFPSLMEGFGLPVLEAMRFGVPVVCSRSGPLPEVGGQAAAYVDPESVADIAGVMRDVLLSPSRQQEMKTRGFEQFRGFDFRQTAARVAEIYRQILGMN